MGSSGKKQETASEKKKLQPRRKGGTRARSLEGRNTPARRPNSRQWQEEKAKAGKEYLTARSLKERASQTYEARTEADTESGSFGERKGSR